MKIQSLSEKTFKLVGKNAQGIINPKDISQTQDLDFTLISQFGSSDKSQSKKTFALPGEFEISGVLIKSFVSDSNQNNIFKVAMDDVVCAHLGTFREEITPEKAEQLGENIDVAFINVAADFGYKKILNLLDKIEPRAVIFYGDRALFPELKSKFAISFLEENEKDFSRNILSEEKTDYYIFSN